MVQKKSAKNELIEVPTRIEPARVEEPTEALSDVVADLSATSATLGKALHPRTAANLADVVRIMNTYYSNLIEGHNTRPKDIERALAGNFDDDERRRNLQIEAAAHVRVQAEVDRMAAENRLPEPASADFIRWLHREFYRDAPQEMLRITEPVATSSWCRANGARSRNTMLPLVVTCRRRANGWMLSCATSRAVIALRISARPAASWPSPRPITG